MQLLQNHLTVLHPEKFAIGELRMLYKNCLCAQ